MSFLHVDRWLRCVQSAQENRVVSAARQAKVTPKTDVTVEGDVDLIKWPFSDYVLIKNLEIKLY